MAEGLSARFPDLGRFSAIFYSLKPIFISRDLELTADTLALGWRAGKKICARCLQCRLTHI